MDNLTTQVTMFVLALMSNGVSVLKWSPAHIVSQKTASLRNGANGLMLEDAHRSTSVRGAF